MDVITKACTLCSTTLSKLMFSLDFHPFVLLIMQAALICRVFWRFVSQGGEGVSDF